MGVCCIVFDIDGMLSEFFMNFLNIEKNKILRIYVFQYFMFSSRFMLFPTFKKNVGVKKNFWGGGRAVVDNFCFCLKNNSFLFHFAFYAIFNIKQKFGNIEKFPLHLLQILDGDSGNLYLYIYLCPIYPLFPCSDFVSQMWEWLGGGNVFLAYYAISNISRKRNLGIKVFFIICCFLCVLWMLDLFPTFFLGILENCPFTYWLNGRWFLQIVDIGNFNMKLNGRWFPQIVDRDSGNLYPIYIYKKLWC